MILGNGVSVAPQQNLKALTSLRFFAALAILFFHVPYVLPKSVGINFFPHGALAVEFFFILSGFILMHVYSEKYLNVKDFTCRRMSRLLPLHYITLLVWLTINFKDWGCSLPDKINSGIANVLLIQAFFSGDLFNLGYNAVSWALSAEMFFYLVFPVLIRKKRYMYLFFAYLIVFLFMSSHVAQKVTAAIPNFFYFNPFARLMEFVCGMSLYGVFKIKKPHIFIVSCAQILSLVLLVLIVPFITSQAPQLQNALLLVPFSGIILFFAWDGLVSRILSWHGFVILGEASLSLYLTHHMYFGFVDSQLAKLDTPPLVALGIATISAILLALIVTRMIEKPTQKIFLRFCTKN